jgi:hypothetical protein
MRIFFLGVVTLFFIGCSSDFGETKQLIVEFDGSGGDYHEKYNLTLVIKDSIIVNSILNSFKNSESHFLSCPGHRPATWRIETFEIDEKNSLRHLNQILFINKNAEIGMWNNTVNKCYKNDSLINFMIDITKVEEIRKFNGPMTQSDYDKLFESESSK